mmetsp:Transcript_4369/g.5794  ORF Transcript_4369/g.5794 Transcript_4369/m.5794 type:complete len:94 (+) Transcript_4369:7-288(+)
MNTRNTCLINRDSKKTEIIREGNMPVPRRRKSKGGIGGIMGYPLMTLKLFNADFVFQKTRTVLLYGFAPAVVLLGMTLEPTPASWFEIINLLE